MKKILFILFFINTLAFSQSSIYGISGTPFVPNAFVANNHKFGISSTMDFTFWNFRGNFWKERIEISLSNTTGIIGKESGYNPESFNFPFVPTIKVAITEKQKNNLLWGYAVGFAKPYGLIFNGSALFSFPFIQPEATVGLGIAGINKFYAMGSFKFFLADKNRNPLPIGFMADAAAAISSKHLGLVEELFYSFGAVASLTRNLNFELFYRIDPQTSHYISLDGDELDKKLQNKDGQIFLRLTVQFDGFKKLPKNGGN